VADTGSPWFIPFAEPTDLVRDWPDLSEDVADAVAAGLDAAGGLVAVKTVLKTDTFTASVASSANVAVTGLSIDHAVASATNRLVILAMFGLAANSSQRAQTGIAIADNGTLIGIGDSALTRTRVAANQAESGQAVFAVFNSHIHIVHTPGDTATHTYTVRAINGVATTQTVYVNRTEDDVNDPNRSRGVSAITIMEVKV
jgi:hypothetical protein